MNGKRILITGGASGIGRIISGIMLEKGAEVIVWDISEKNIADTLAELSPKGVISGYQIDVSNYDMVSRTASKVGDIDILINNAGIVVGRDFSEHSAADINRVMGVNITAPLYLTQQFLPAMIKRGSGNICNIASMAATVSNPRMSVYAASKWALFGWSDSLRLEMERNKTNVKVTTILPYYINTGMFDGVKSNIPILKPEKAANKIVKYIIKGKRIKSIPGWLYSSTRFFQGVLPLPIYDFVVGKIFGIYTTMDNFVGRK